MECSALLFLLLCSVVLGSPAGAGQAPDQFVYKFGANSHGDMVCTNWPAGVGCTNPPPGTMNTAGSSDSHRHIISFQGEGNYALGFETATFGSWYLSTYTYDPATKSAGVSIWRATETYGPVDLQISGNASLIFRKNGNLELRDSKGVLRWTPDAWGLGVTEFVFNVRKHRQSTAGNMILYNSAKQVAWQSLRPKGGNKFQLSTIHRPDMICTTRSSSPRVDCKPDLEYPMHPSAGTNQYRNIISSTSDGKYALGFWATGSKGSFNLAIYQWNPSTNLPSRVPTWRLLNYYHQPILVPDGSSISFLQKGDIELRDNKNKLVWTTGTKGRASDVEFNFDTGVLYLYNLQGSILWRSDLKLSLVDDM